MNVFNFSTRRVGGIRFIKLGRLNISLSVSREYRDLNRPKLTPLPAPKDAGRFRHSIDGVLVLGFADEYGEAPLEWRPHSKVDPI